MDNKKILIKLDGGKLSIKVDTNQDGETVLDVELNLSEALDEIVKLFKKG